MEKLSSEYEEFVHEQLQVIIVKSADYWERRKQLLPVMLEHVKNSVPDEKVAEDGDRAFDYCFARLENVFKFFGIYNSDDEEQKQVLRNLSSRCVNFAQGDSTEESFMKGIEYFTDYLIKSNPDKNPNIQPPDWHGENPLPEDLYSISCLFSRLVNFIKI